MLHMDLSGILPFIEGEKLSDFSAVEAAHQQLIQKTGLGVEYTGWLTLPRDYDREETERIKKAAAKIRSDSEILVVIGIGGSYLGARAAIEFARTHAPDKKSPTILFVGNNLSGEYLAQILDLVRDRDFSVNVISKSGTTIEPAIAFRIFKNLLEERYGREAAGKRIYATTDKRRGALKRLAEDEGYESFVVPDDIGGRYSVLTPVGLLPMAAAGLDIDVILQSAAEAMEEYAKAGSENPVWQYANARQRLYETGKKIEVMACYEPSFHYLCEWWKQLYGESEGKNGRGIFPAGVELTTDLHSMGQYLQDGERILMETVISVQNSRRTLTVPFMEGDVDELNYLAGRDLHYINSQALSATKKAHIAGGVPCMEIQLREMSEKSFGRLVYFFMLACGISGYTMGIDPFDQPGVEAYKKNMLALLGKPGFEELRAQLMNFS